MEEGRPVCVQELCGWSDEPAWLVVALRPYNPEGVSFIHDVELLPDDDGWQRRGQPASAVQRRRAIGISSRAIARETSSPLLPQGSDTRSVRCDVGMATAAAMFALTPGRPRQIIGADAADGRGALPQRSRRMRRAGRPGRMRLRGHAALDIPDERMQFLYDAALRTLVLHSPLDVYPGPYTYKRFWFRDAAFILHAMLAVGLHARARRTIERFWARQTHAGYFLSQEGEWDSNGEALWILDRYCQLTGEAPPEHWKTPIAPRRTVDRAEAALGSARQALRRAAAGRLQRRTPGPERLLLLGRLLGRCRAALRCRVARASGGAADGRRASAIRPSGSWRPSNAA